MDGLFKPHMSVEEVQKLKVGDKIDYRHPINHYFRNAKIIQRDESKATVKVHCFNQDAKYDSECSYGEVVYRFAEYQSICGRPAHRLKDIQIGSLVDIKVSNHKWWKMGKVKGWIKGQVAHRYNGQIRVKVTRNGTVSYVGVHLDNVNEVDRFGIRTNIQEMNHIPIAMETKKAYLNTPNEIKEDCAKEIINNVFGGMTNILSYLIKNATTSHLQEMKKIIKKNNIKYLEQLIKSMEKSVDNANEDDSDSLISPHAISSLSQLSSHSITHICGYLDKKDIQSFKLTSFAHGMICLREMKKYNIGTFDTNQFINDTNQKYVDMLAVINTINENYKYERYPSNMKYLSLQQIWQDKHNIPCLQQLAISGKKATTAFYDTQKINSLTEWPLSLFPNKKGIIIFDKRNTILFNETNTKPKIMDSCAITVPYESLNIVLLKWFDIYLQEIIPLQFVMGHVDLLTVGRLTKYIQNEFISTTKKQKNWYSNVMVGFKTMNNISPHHQNVIVHKEYANFNAIVLANNPIDKLPFFISLVFQFNPYHPTFAKKKFATIQEKYQLLTT